VSGNYFRAFSQGFSHSAAQVAVQLGGNGRPNSSDWYAARCPCHDDHRFSLSLKDVTGGVVAKCFAGCKASDIKDAIRQIMQGTLVVAPTTPVRPKLTPDDMARIVGRIEAECVRNTGTLVEVYIRRRWITVELAPTLLFHPWLYHAESGASAPAMVALLQAAGGDRVPAIHRTWLTADGSGKANLSPVRKSLGSVSGHSVHLGRPSVRLIVGEGVETTLSAWQMWGHSFDAWATLSTSGMAALIVPATVTEVVIASDNDPAGRQAAAALRDRLLRENPARKINVYTPKGDASDFNDVLVARMVA
jgi:putative DNA primase/helicase